MRTLNIILLLSVAIFCSGYRFRCYAFCNDQTAIQNDYVEQRDECRDYAQNNLNAEMAKSKTPDSGKARKEKLVTIFSECMSKYGWDVPSGNEKGDKGKLADKGEVPIYVSSVSKQQPKETPTAVAVGVNDETTKETDKIEQRDLNERKVPPENIDKQPEGKGKESTSTKETNKEKDSNSSSIATQKTDTVTTSQDGESQPKSMRTQPATTIKKSKAEESKQKTIEKTKSTNTTKTESNTQETVKKEQAPPAIIQQQQPTNVVRENRDMTNANGKVEHMRTQPATTKKPEKTKKTKSDSDSPDQALSEAIHGKSTAKTEPNQTQGSQKNISAIKPEAGSHKTDMKSETVQQQNILRQNALKEKARANYKNNGEKTEYKEQSRQPIAIQQQQPDSAVRSKQSDSLPNQTEQLENIKQQPVVTKKSTADTAPANTKNTNAAEQALSESIKKKSASEVEYRNTSKANSSIEKNANKTQPQSTIPQQPREEKQKELYERKTPSENIQIQKQAIQQQNVNEDSSIIKQTSSDVKTITKETQKETHTTEQTKSVAVEKQSAGSSTPPPSANQPINATTNPPISGNDGSAIASQPKVTKGKTSKQRAKECEMARSSASTSNSAAKLAKACAIECTKLLKEQPEIINHAPCPAKDTAVDLLDIQLGNKK
jgi:hypothetical protein